MTVAVMCHDYKRPKDESPAQFYRRTGHVDRHFTKPWRGWYYCNPAHCKGRWRSRVKRDEHLNHAYAALGGP